MYRLRDLIKKEYYLLISREGGAIVISPSNSTYLLVPKEIARRLRDFGIDLNDRKARERIEVRCELVMEPSGHVNLVYSFWEKAASSSHSPAVAGPPEAEGGKAVGEATRVAGAKGVSGR